MFCRCQEKGNKRIVQLEVSVLLPAEKSKKRPRDFLSSLEGSLDFPNFNIVTQLSYIEWKSCVSQIRTGPFKFQCTFYKLTSQNSACSKIVPLYNAPVLFLTGLTCFLDISRSIYIFVCDSNGGRGKIKQIRRSVITVLGRRRKGTGIRKYSVWC